MRKSRVREKEFSQDQWVISVINGGEGTKGKLFGHSVLLIEGIKADHLSHIPKEKIFVGQYDILFDRDDVTSDSSIANVKGYVCEVRVIENLSTEEEKVYTHPSGDKFYRETKARSFHVSYRDAQNIIASIKADEKRTLKALEDESAGLKGDFIRYQLSGSKGTILHKIFINQKGGINCAEWCLYKLNIANIDLDTAPKPNKVAGGCNIL